MKDLFFYPSDPEFDELGSLEITGAFIDEANQITSKARNIVKSRIRFKLKEFGLIPKLLMTCNPAKNWTYTDFYKPNRDGNLPTHRKFIQALLSDNPHISEHYRNNLLGLDKVSKMRLLEGEWEYDDDPTKLINFDAIVDIFNNSHVETGLRCITADVARLGSDKAVVIVWDGLQVVEINTMDISKINEIAEVIKSFQNKYQIPNRNVIADEDGVGGGLIDFMGIRGFVNNSTALNKENYTNLKSQCYYKLANYINDSKIWIKPNQYKDEIIEELEQVKTYKIDSDTKLRILPKDKVKENLGRSPDFSDTLMMRMYFELTPQQKTIRKVY